MPGEFFKALWLAMTFQMGAPWLSIGLWGVLVVWPIVKVFWIDKH